MNKYRVFRFASNYWINRFLYKTSLSEKKPWSVVINPTLSCNLRCKNCDIWKLMGYGTKLGVKEWKGIILNIRKWLGPFYLTISGGEPLLEKDMVKELIEFASKNCILTSLVTNGWFLNKETVRGLESSKLDTLSISLDGFRPETHDRIRGRRGTHRRILSAIEYIKKEGIGIGVNINTTIMEPNLDELESLTEWANANDNTPIRFQALVDNFGRGTNNPYWFQESELWPADTGKVVRTIDKIISMKQRGVCVKNPLRQLNTFKMYYENPIKACGSFVCNTDRAVSVFPDGDMRICTRMRPVGNLRVNDAKRIWSSQESKRTKIRIKGCKRQCKILNCNFSYSSDYSLYHVLSLG